MQRPLYACINKHGFICAFGLDISKIYFALCSYINVCIMVSIDCVVVLCIRCRWWKSVIRVNGVICFGVQFYHSLCHIYHITSSDEGGQDLLYYRSCSLSPLSVCLSGYLFLSLSLCLPVCLYVFLSLSLSLPLPLYLCLCLSLSPPSISRQDIGGDLTPSLHGGREKSSQTKISEWRYLRKNFPFSRPKFLMTLFLVIDHDFKILHIFAYFRIWPFLHKKNPYFRK